jgi:hypothetical protein
VQEALNKIQPMIAKARANNPQQGVLLLFYYTQVQAPPDSAIKPGAQFHYVIWGQGPTQDEAKEDAFSTPSISVGTHQSQRKFSQQVWLPPLQKSAITTAKCPFPPIAIGRFVLHNGNKIKFQLVDFNRHWFSAILQ